MSSPSELFFSQARLLRSFVVKSPVAFPHIYLEPSDRFIIRSVSELKVNIVSVMGSMFDIYVERYNDLVVELIEKLTWIDEGWTVGARFWNSSYELFVITGSKTYKRVTDPSDEVLVCSSILATSNIKWEADVEVEFASGREFKIVKENPAGLELNKKYMVKEWVRNCKLFTGESIPKTDMVSLIPLVKFSNSRPGWTVEGSRFKILRSNPSNISIGNHTVINPSSYMTVILKEGDSYSNRFSVANNLLLPDMYEWVGLPTPFINYSQLSGDLRALIEHSPGARCTKGFIRAELGVAPPKDKLPTTKEDWQKFIEETPIKRPLGSGATLASAPPLTFQQEVVTNVLRGLPIQGNLTPATPPPAVPTTYVHVVIEELVEGREYYRRRDSFIGTLPVPTHLMQDEQAARDWIFQHYQNHLEREHGDSEVVDSEDTDTEDVSILDTNLNDLINDNAEEDEVEEADERLQGGNEN